MKKKKNKKTKNKLDYRIVIFGIGMILLLITVIYYAPYIFNSGNNMQANVIVEQDKTDEIPTYQELLGTGELSRELIMTYLEGIKDPEVDAPLVEVVSLTQQDIEINNGKVKIDVNLPPWCPLKERITSDIEKEISVIKGVESVKVRLTWRGYEGVESRPQITDYYLKPEKIIPGDKVELKVDISDYYGVVSVNVEISKDKSAELSIISGDSYEGVWQAKWTAEETEKDYVSVIAVNELGETLTEKIGIEYNE